MKDIIAKAQTTHNLNRQEILRLLKDSSVDDEIFSAADKVRKEYVGDEVHLRALIEFSNICKCRCKYCGLRFENDKIERYKLSPDEIFCFAKKAADYGYKTVVLQSGQSDAYPLKKLKL